VKRSGKASGKRSKALPRSPAKLKRGNAPVVRQRGAGATDLRQKLHARQLREMQEQQVATSEVLRAISNSRGDLEPVFQAMLRNATRICAAKFGILFRFHDGLFHPASLLGVPPPFADALDRQGPFPPVPGRLFGRLSKTKKVVHILDRATEAIVSPAVRYGGARSSIGVPLLKNNELVGAFFIYRTKVQPFTQRQIELVQTFADQAVIAIDNARLLNELRQRTTDLTESLDYQTATSSVLGAISKSPTDLGPVFDTIVACAARLCDAAFSAVARFDGGLLHLVAVNKMSPAETAAYHTVFPRPPNRSFIMGRAFVDGEPVHVKDIEADPDYDPRTLAVLQAAAPYRTYLGVPIVRDGVPIGVIGCGRREVKPFTDAQIALVKTFADQAVIAIENTRLFEAERARTHELSESLEQQTATSEVLQVISSSSGELAPVFESLLASAKHLCGAEFGVIFLREADAFRTVALHGANAEYTEARWRAPLIRPAADTGLGRVLKTKQVGQILDVQEVAGYVENPVQAPLVQLAGVRSKLTVPMLKEEDLIGVIEIDRQEVRPFTEKQIELVSNFAKQAVIAIENARLRVAATADRDSRCTQGHQSFDV
jgi:two-component system, NtrC family, sensor kinase